MQKKRSYSQISKRKAGYVYSTGLMSFMRPYILSKSTPLLIIGLFVCIKCIRVQSFLWGGAIYHDNGDQDYEFLNNVNE